MLDACGRERRFLAAAGIVLVALVFLAVALEPPEVRGGDARDAYLMVRAWAVGARAEAVPIDHHVARWAVLAPLRAVVALDPDAPVLLHVPPGMAFVLAAWGTFVAARRAGGAFAGWVGVAVLFVLPQAARAASQPLPDGFVAAGLAWALVAASGCARRPRAWAAALVAAPLALAYGARISSLIFAPVFGWFIARCGGRRAVAVFTAVLLAVVLLDNALVAVVFGRVRFALVRAGHAGAMGAFALDGFETYVGRLAAWPVPWLWIFLLATGGYAWGRRHGTDRAVVSLAFATAAAYVLVLTYGLSDPTGWVPLSRLRPRYLLAVGPALAVVVGVGAGGWIEHVLPRRGSRLQTWLGGTVVAAALWWLGLVGARDPVPRGLAALRATGRLDAHIDEAVARGLRFAGRGRRGRRALEAVAAVYVDTESLVQDDRIPPPKIDRLPGRHRFWVLDLARGPTGGPLRCPVPVGLKGRFLTVGEPAEDDFTCFPLAPRSRRSAPRPLRGRPPPPQRHGR